MKPKNTNMEENDAIVLKSRNATTETAAIEPETTQVAAGWYMLFIASILLITFSLAALTQKQITVAEQGALVAATVALEEEAVLKQMEAKVAPFELIEIEAQTAYVYDVVTDKELYVRNKDLRMPLASITKIMTALVASEYLAPNDIVTITTSDYATEGVSGFYMNEQWKAKELIDFTLITSSNDGATALARTAGEQILLQRPTLGTDDPLDAFVKMMNIKAEQIGMTNTVYRNPTGLDLNETTGGAYGSAADVGLLMRYILEETPFLLTATQALTSQKQSESSFVHTATNTNESVQTLPGIIASKTGFTDLAGGNLSVIFDSGIGTPIVIVVLGSSFEGRFADVEDLLWASLESVSVQ